MDVIDEIFSVLEGKGGRHYGDAESVTQLEHALQCATNAEGAGAEPGLITAALLHDIGHLINPDSREAIKREEDARHEYEGAAYLAQWFDDDVWQPVRHHVAAKRYLTATDDRYFSRLSPGSVRSLNLQGGPFDAAKADEFITQPFAKDGVRVRRWDEAAKVVGAKTPSLCHFRQYIEASLKK